MDPSTLAATISSAVTATDITASSNGSITWGHTSTRRRPRAYRLRPRSTSTQLPSARSSIQSCDLSVPLCDLMVTEEPPRQEASGKLLGGGPSPW